MSKPKLVVAVTLDEPTAGSYYAGRIVAPIFADIMGNALRQVGILPDAPQTMSQPIIDPATVMEEVI